MTPSDFGRVGRELRDQYGYLRRFARQIKSGDQRLDGRFRARVKLYAQSGLVSYTDAEAELAARMGRTEERNVIDPGAEHCEECKALSARGWVPIGTLPRPGRRRCLSNCRCRLEYRGDNGRRLEDPLDEPGYPPANPGAPDSLGRFTRPDGTLTPERQRLHDRILRSELRGKRPAPPGEAVVQVLGGGPASGKSVTLSKMGDVPDLTIDVDHIRTRLPEYPKMLARGDANAAAWNHEESSMLGKRVVAEAAARGISFVADGTGDSGIESLAKKVATYRKSGARVLASYVTVDVETAMQRMRARGDRTGRYVPESYLRQVHSDVSRTFEAAIERGLFDEFKLYDTSPVGGEPILVVSGRGKELTVHDAAAWERFRAKGRVGQ